MNGYPSPAARPAAQRLAPRALEALLLADPLKALVACAACFVGVAVADFLTPVQLNLTFAYVSILLVVCWHAGARWGLGFAMLAFALQVIGFAVEDGFATISYSHIILWNRLFTFLVVVALMAAVRSLYDGLQRNGENLRAMSRHLVEMQEAERRRLSRELHDCAGQPLAGLAISLDIVRGELPAGASDALRTRLSYCKACADDMMDWMRGALDELRPTMLDSLGLAPALRKLARELPHPAPFEATVKVAGEPWPLEHDVALALFRIVQESLVNASRHSGVPSVLVSLDYREASLTVVVEDLGRGFDPDRDRRAKPRGFGLLVMHERATAVGARLAVESAPGAGTRIVVEAARAGAARAGDFRRAA